MDVSADTPAITKTLRDVNVLIVEDDYLQASISAMALEESGATVLGPVPDVEDARRLLDVVSPDCVVLDLRLRDDYAFLLADELQSRGIPTVLATGYDPSVFPFRPAPNICLLKPFTDDELVDAVTTALCRQHAIAVEQPGPRFLQQ